MSGMAERTGLNTDTHRCMCIYVYTYMCLFACSFVTISTDAYIQHVYTYTHIEICV